MATNGYARQGSDCSDVMPVSLKNGTQTLNKGTDEEMFIEGYRSDSCKTFLFYLLCVLTLGLLLLILYWKPEWEIYLRKSRCTLKEADTLLLTDTYSQKFTEEIITQDIPGARSDIYLIFEQPSSSNSESTNILQGQQRSSYIRFFDYRHGRYMWDEASNQFKRLRGLDESLSCGQIHDNFGQGLKSAEQVYKLQLFGENKIDVEVKSYGKLFIEEVLNPFYIFQICSMILWSLDDYYIYAGAIFFISAISLSVELYETRKQRVTLRDMVATEEPPVEVIRDGIMMDIVSENLVPGDLLLMPPGGCVMSCDAVLLTGNAIVNESMLTGESVPVTKTPLIQSEAGEIYSPTYHKHHTLFCGTKVIQTRFYGTERVKAVVTRTGFATAKGELVRSILFPRPLGFKFYQDSIRFILCLSVVAMIGMTYSIIILLKQGTPAKTIVLRALDIITVVVPPALPAAMTVGTVYAQNRLKAAGIFCISPPRINICGKMKLVCFDKTGTLTEEGLDMWGVLPCENAIFQNVFHNPTLLPSRSPLIVAMATCHSLTRIDGEVNGDPLDLKMFISTNWLLQEPGKDTSKFDAIAPTTVKPVTRETYYEGGSDEIPFEIGLIRQFPFSSSLQRMSVITRTLDAPNMELYAKGAPEKIASFCLPETVPEDFHSVLKKHTARGFRVIALAWRPLDPKLSWHQAQKISRDAIEKDLIFLGLMIMENTLKPETKPVIKQLNHAEIRTVMVTGDNMLTALSVARQCCMIPEGEQVVLVDASIQEKYPNAAQIKWELAEAEIEGEPEIAVIPHERVDVVEAEGFDHKEVYNAVTAMQMPETHRYHFAISGKSFAVIKDHFPELMDRLCVRGTIFARMSPDQKTQLVEHLQSLGYCVGMCGDGANDCGALKAAHAGISLSDAEASVASPFTSRTPNIECVPTVIREGRAALVTSFGVFKYMALYSMIQFVTVLILYSRGSNLGDLMFLYVDLLITTTVAVLMGHTGAYHKLVKRRPMGSLVSPSNIFSVAMAILVVAAFQTGAFFYVTMQPWYISVPGDVSDDYIKTYETTALFYISSFQYLIMAYAFSRGPPYRKPIYTNVLFLLSLLILALLTAFLIIYPVDPITGWLELLPFPSMQFRATFIGVILMNFLVVLLIEKFVVPSQGLGIMCNKIRRKKFPRNKYKLIEKELGTLYDWPPLGRVSTSGATFSCS